MVDKDSHLATEMAEEADTTKMENFPFLEKNASALYADNRFSSLKQLYSDEDNNNERGETSAGV